MQHFVDGDRQRWASAVEDAAGNDVDGVVRRHACDGTWPAPDVRDSKDDVTALSIDQADDRISE